jgi:magnesium-transporting ATPase (P-type)
MIGNLIRTHQVGSEDINEDDPWSGFLAAMEPLSSQFHEEGKAYKIVDSFSQMLASNCITIQNGKEKAILTNQLVPGDLVKITNGKKVPVDLVLLLC